MDDKTTEFSFALKPTAHGIGVFAVHDIKAGAFLRLFGEGAELNDRSVVRATASVPEFFSSYCIQRGETMICPQDFGCMPVGWYLNHSSAPNAIHRDYFLVRDARHCGRRRNHD